MTVEIEQVLAGFDAEMAAARDRLEDRLRILVTESGQATTAGLAGVVNEVSWTFVEERKGERYPWPQGMEHYDGFWVYRASDGRQFALGRVAEGREQRPIWMTFLLGGGGGSKRPVVLFTATDDYAETGEAAALIRGKGPTGKAMYGMDDPLPTAYESMRIERYRDRVVPESGYSYDKAAVIARADDHATMLAHALAQVDLRGLEPATA